MSAQCLKRGAKTSNKGSRIVNTLLGALHSENKIKRNCVNPQRVQERTTRSLTPAGTAFNYRSNTGIPKDVLIPMGRAAANRHHNKPHLLVSNPAS